MGHEFSSELIGDPPPRTYQLPKLRQMYRNGQIGDYWKRVVVNVRAKRAMLDATSDTKVSVIDDAGRLSTSSCDKMRRLGSKGNKTWRKVDGTETSGTGNAFSATESHKNLESLASLRGLHASSPWRGKTARRRTCLRRFRAQNSC